MGEVADIQPLSNWGALRSLSTAEENNVGFQGPLLHLTSLSLLVLN